MKINLKPSAANASMCAMTDWNLWQDIHICAWCMPKGIPGTHGICQKCMKRVMGT